MALRPVNEKHKNDIALAKARRRWHPRVVPELERRLGRFEPSDIVGLNFQMRRQIVKEPYLVAAQSSARLPG